MKKFIMSLLLISTLFTPAIAQESPCHDVKITLEFLKTYGFNQQWVGTIPNTGSTLFIFQDAEGRWSQWMVTIDQQTNTPVMCSITAGDKGVTLK